VIRLLLIVILLLQLSACGPEKHYCDTHDCSSGAENSSMGRRICADRFISLMDTTRILADETNACFNIDFQKNALHFYAKLTEDDIRYKYDTRDTCIWKDPCIEFFFDPGADGIDYYEMQFNAAPQIWDLKIRHNIGPINAPENMITWDIGNNWGIQKFIGTANNASDTDEFWTLVGTVPWDRISEGKPKSGDVWAYNFMRVDYDGAGHPTYWVAHPTGKNMIHYPENWPKFTF